MRLGWLWNNFSDPHLRLTAAQRREALRIAHEHHVRGRVGGVTMFVVVPPLLGLIVGTSLVDGWVAAKLGTSETMASALLIGVVVLLSWPWSALVYGRLYARPYRRALRDRGLRVCLGCGYVMDGLGGEGAVCPECGEREPRPGEAGA